MLAPSLPENESSRLSELHGLCLLDTDPEHRFDQLTQLASLLFEVPMALISLVDADRQWFKSRQGLEASETPRRISFCGHAILADDLLVVEDASQDVRFADNPLVTDSPRIRFYAGYPLSGPNGFKVGTLCIIDVQPRLFTERERWLLAELGKLVEKELTAMVLRDALQALEEARQQAELANKAKGVFLANMSHEIRTPLNAVLGMAHLLAATPLNAEQGKFLEMIRVSGESLLDLLNDILDFSKIEAGRMELALAPFSMEEILAPLASIMTVNAGEKGLELAIGIAPSVPGRLLGDALRIKQILVNLTGNAIKFTESGEVSVLVELLNQEDALANLLIRVRDTGPGMDANQQLRLFSEFSQGDASTSRRYGGTGLGLAICKRLVDMMGGRIEVDSVLGQGSEFKVLLPLPIASDVIDSRPPELLNLHILVVDDNRTSREYLSQSIRALGWQASVAHSGEAAIGLCQNEGTFDVVLIDWDMPDLNGLQTAQALQKMGTQPPLLLLMAGAFEHSRLLASGGADQSDGVLIKPVTGSSLFDLLHELRTREGRDAVIGEVPLSSCMGTPLKGLSLLLVEDNALNQLVARGMLEQSGARVDVVGNGQEALERLREAAEDYSLVLMDVQMPVLDGLSATRVLRQQLGLSVPVIAMTAGVTEVEQAACHAAGMNDLIAKPIHLEQMLNCILRYWQGAAGSSPLPGTNQVALPCLDMAPHLMTGRNNPGYLLSLQGLMADAIVQAPLQFHQLDQAWQAGQHAQAARELHRLRGALGSLGAKAFADHALRLENAIKQDLPDQKQILALFEETRQSLEKMLVTASAWLAQQAPGVARQTAKLVAPLALEQLNHWSHLLSAHDFAACDDYKVLRPSLVSLLSPEALLALDHAMNDLDFAQALAAIDGLAERIIADASPPAVA